MCHRTKIAVMNIANAFFARGWQRERVCVCCLGKRECLISAGGKKCHLLHRQVSTCALISPPPAQPGVEQTRKFGFEAGRLN